MLIAEVPRPTSPIDGTYCTTYETTYASTNNPVEHPSHYTYGKIECIDFIEDKGLNFNRGNAIKYIVRAGHKENELEDLEKAAWYINREIQRIKKEVTA